MSLGVYNGAADISSGDHDDDDDGVGHGVGHGDGREVVLPDNRSQPPAAARHDARHVVASEISDSDDDIDDDDDDDDDEDMDEEEYDGIDERIRIGTVTAATEVNQAESDELSDDMSDYSTDNSHDIDRVNSTIESITPELVAQTRRFLKREGSTRFLEEYLPTTARSRDIIRLIAQLGFVMKRLPAEDSDESNLMDYVNVLNHAMMKVVAERDRLEHVSTFEDALQLINKSNKILIITGAGISTSLGIPDFRSSKGFYSMVQHLGLSDPQEVFDLEIFNSDPNLFYSIAHMVLPPENTYSPLHSFVYLLQHKGKLLRNYTQNIDNLESYAGILPQKIVQCHGSFATATCMTCRTQIPGEKIFDKIRSKQIPYCRQCELTRKKLLKRDEDAYIPENFGVYKPDITFFGEALPSRFHDLVLKDIAECDLLISVGTSLKVAPVADIVDKVPHHIPQILINKDPIDHCNFDVSLLGYCDDVAALISHRLGDDWSLPHEQYEKIRLSNGENLRIELVDSHLREYEIVNLDQEQVMKEKVIAAEHGRDEATRPEKGGEEKEEEEEEDDDDDDDDSDII
ncbi:uncharacterized protein LODBEIA_P06270 [Lodderomyces beijingensis]|uniref:Deacetylase sirtuin-type domain-containing protein n=1 Tax=Lodderomyces beijingensis TaxID=1775926 RepID=A0ABP0ZE06_9ASCO